MKENLDKWIKDAKVTTPDSGEYRRLNRILMKERMLTTKSGRGRRHWILTVSLILVLLMGLSGSISQLGSDGFHTRKFAGLSARGDSLTLYSNEFRGGTTSLPEDFSPEDVDEFHRSVAAGEGTIYMVTGLSYGGKTSWLKLVVRDINGKENRNGVKPNSPVSQDPDDMLPFLKTFYQDLIARSKTDPPRDRMQREVDGVMIEFGVWTYEYPGYGEVTRYVGYPVSKK